MPEFGSSYPEKHEWIWRTGIIKGNQCAAFGLLLTLLPNVRFLNVSWHGPQQS